MNTRSKKAWRVQITRLVLLMVRGLHIGKDGKMSELNYKELKEKGVFDTPHKAYLFMQEQQKKIDDIQEEYAETENYLKEKITQLEARIIEQGFIIQADNDYIRALRSEEVIIK